MVAVEIKGVKPKCKGVKPLMTHYDSETKMQAFVTDS